uniref:Cell division protein FtsL n=4 Tax=unclassified Prevotella TaxID=2638335 RepID=A0AB33JK47_9BACT
MNKTEQDIDIKKKEEVKSIPSKATGTKSEDAEHDTAGLSLKETIEEQATEGEAPHSSDFTLRKILGGDILNTQAIRRQIGVFLLITFFAIVYTANRYSVQKDLIEIDRLNKTLQDTKYKALSSSSNLTELCRESHVLEMLKNSNDSTLKIANQPPYIINVPDGK